MFATAKMLLSSRLKAHPAIFLPLARWRANDKKQVVAPDSDVVIEGYWRCGNHFATFGFMVAQPRSVRVAHHFHAPAQLIQAVRWNVPAVLLIREPREAVASATVYLEEEDPGPFLKFYRNFHQPLVEYAERLVVSDFPTTVGDLGAVIDAVNARWGRDFARFAGTPDQQAEVERRIREEHEQNMGGVASRLPLPSAEKGALKERIAARMAEPRYAALWAEAQRLYKKFAAVSVGAGKRGIETMPANLGSG